MVARFQVLALIVVILFACKAPAALQRRGTEPSGELQSLVNDARSTERLPGLAVVVVRSDGQPQVYVSGERRIGSADPMTAADRMHLGSLTKAITATVIGALAEQDRMTLDTTIGQAFPELSAKMQPTYRHVTVRQLLTHSGGVTPYRTRESLQWTLALKGTGTEQRYAFLERVLAEPPRFEPNTRHEYSKAGGAIAGAVAERIGGAPYRPLVQKLVFAPLGGHAAFGIPDSQRRHNRGDTRERFLVRSWRLCRPTRSTRPRSRSNQPATSRCRRRTTGVFSNCTCAV